MKLVKDNLEDNHSTGQESNGNNVAILCKKPHISTLYEKEMVDTQIFKDTDSESSISPTFRKKTEK